MFSQECVRSRGGEDHSPRFYPRPLIPGPFWGEEYHSLGWGGGVPLYGNGILPTRTGQGTRQTGENRVYSQLARSGMPVLVTQGDFLVIK